jgi:hypothetical protein
MSRGDGGTVSESNGTVARCAFELESARQFIVQKNITCEPRIDEDFEGSGDGVAEIYMPLNTKEFTLRGICGCGK